MKFKINSTGNVILADLAFVTAHHPGDFTEVVEAAPVVPSSRTLTHLQFRRRFTPAEQEWADELEVTFEANAAFTPAQKRTLRTGYKNFYAASEVSLDDPAIPPMLGLYVALGGLTASRPAEILA